MEIEERKPKIWQTILLYVFAMLGLEFAGGYAQAAFGMYGSLVTEGIMLFLAIVFVFITKGKLKEAFSFKKPTVRGVWGSLLIYFGAGLMMLASTLLISYLLPDISNSTSQYLYYYFTNGMTPFETFVLLTIPPAICEESLFRGAASYGLKGLKPWVIITFTGAVFGIFHTSIIRFFPTAILGMAFALIYLKSGNLFYTMMLHFLNNAFSAISILTVVDSATIEQASSSNVPLISVGLYFIFCAASPFLIKAGMKKFEPKNSLSYYVQPGSVGVMNSGVNDNEYSRAKNTNKLAVIIAVCFALVGAVMIAFDSFNRTELLDVNSIIYVDCDDEIVASFDFSAEKYGIYYLEYDVKAERGLAELTFTDDSGNVIGTFAVQESSGKMPMILDEGEYHLEIYSHVGDLWEYCRENNLSYTEEGDLITLNMAGDMSEESELSYVLCIK